MQKHQSRYPRLGETEHIGLILHCANTCCRARGWVPLTSAVLNRSVREIGARARCRHCGGRGADAEILRPLTAPVDPKGYSPYRNVAHLRAVRDAIRSNPFYRTKPHRKSSGHAPTVLPAANPR